jgi:uncharacterized alpha-E superfamily protein
MLSRVAENLYWIGRYVERAENLARLLGDAFDLGLDAAGLGGADGRGQLDDLLHILAVRDDFDRRFPAGDRDTVLRYLTFDRGNPQSIVTMVGRARENARGSQEALSAEAWSQVNRVYLHVSGPRAERRFAASPSRYFDSIQRGCILFGGFVDETLPRSEAYHFLQAGRHLERADTVCRLVAVRLAALAAASAGDAPALRGVRLTSLLRGCSAYEAYLKTYQDRLHPHTVVRYLVFDTGFPRAVRFCVDRMQESVRQLPGSGGSGYGSETERQIGRLEGELRYADVEEVFARGVGDFLQGVLDAVARVHGALGQAYFLTESGRGR